jgi:cobaltochelatase CobS subunit
MAQMPAAATAMHFRPLAQQTPVCLGPDRARQGFIERWPASTAVELRGRREERQVTSRTVELTVAMLVIERAAKGSLGILLAQDAILGRRQKLAPLRLGMSHLERLLGHRPTGSKAQHRQPAPESQQTSARHHSLHSETHRRNLCPRCLRIDTDMKVKGFAERTDRVPEIDPTYKFDPDTTLAILAGFAYNRRVMIQGYHGTGKSTHIEQVAARLNWPCVRVNLDSHISRIDLIGKDAIKLRDGKQVTEFHEGILPWALRNPVAIVFDEYDAGRADVMFVIQRVLEHDGKLTLLDQNEIITPHPSFRLFATANTVGLGDTTGLYHGTQQINQAQMDRWSLVATLNYLSHDAEAAIVLAKNAPLQHRKGPQDHQPDGDRGRPDPHRLHERRSVHRHVARAPC